MAYLNMMPSFSKPITYVHQKTKTKKKREREKERKEKTNKQDTLTTFQILQQQETWESVYQKQDTNCMYNIFLSTFLIILSKTRY